MDKFAERRDQLAAAARQTLAELGYANTSLRDIAQNSEFSHGVLHYYFADKFELITYCVRQYKAECVTALRLHRGHRGARADELRAEIGAAMARTLRDDAGMHRLWYDLRNQSQFDEAFRPDVSRDRPVARADDLADRQPVRRAGGPAPAVSPRWPTPWPTACSSTRCWPTWPGTRRRATSSTPASACCCPSLVP